MKSEQTIMIIKKVSERIFINENKKSAKLIKINSFVFNMMNYIIKCDIKKIPYLNYIV